ncbi:MAG: SDR family NAD(P)-dependent oxidoreductase [Anaerolineales bacterium]
MRKIIIFGATGAIGSASAHRLHSASYQLHLVGRNEEALDKLATELNASMTCGDVLDADLFSRVAEEAGDAVGGLVYAVGTLNLKNLGRLTEEDFILDFRVNALGAVLAVQALLPAFKGSSRPSSIVLFSSVAVAQGFKYHASIGMAKGAVEGLTLSLAAELTPTVRVNAIAPSLTETPLSAGLLSNEKMAEAIAKLHPMARLGTPEDIAALVAFLISDDSSWMTGQVIGVDGGRSTLRTKS